MGKLADEVNRMEKKLLELKRDYTLTKRDNAEGAALIDAEYEELALKYTNLKQLVPIESAIEQLNDINPYIQDLLPNLQTLIPGIIKFISEIIVDVRGTIQPDIVKMQQIDATQYRSLFMALLKEGFTDNQAMSLLLATIKPTNMIDVATALPKNIPGK
jgi:hypothetical protein